jgi:hypothetical protein
VSVLSALVVPCPAALAARMSTDKSRKALVLFIGSDLAYSLRIFKRVLSLSYNNAVSRVFAAVKAAHPLSSLLIAFLQKAFRYVRLLSGLNQSPLLA